MLPTPPGVTSRNQVYNTAQAIELFFVNCCTAKFLSWVGRDPVSDIWNRNTVDQGAIVFDLDSSLSHQLESQRVNAVLNFQYADCECLFTVARPYSDHALSNDWSGIHLRHNEMHGRTMNFCDRLKDAPVCVQALEIRQQGGVNVENPSLPFL